MAKRVRLQHKKTGKTTEVDRLYADILVKTGQYARVRDEAPAAAPEPASTPAPTWNAAPSVEPVEIEPDEEPKRPPRRRRRRGYRRMDMQAEDGTE